MAYNKVVYDQKVLIDLTSDTVAEKNLIVGERAHNKSGEVIKGTFLKGIPETFVLETKLEDSSGEYILDSSSNEIIGTATYVRK